MSGPLKEKPELVSALNKVAWVPILFFVAAIAVVYCLDFKTTAESPMLLTLFNLVFCSSIAFLAAWLAAVSYLDDGEPAVLFLGTGMMAWSFVTAIVGLMVRDMNAQLTMHNSGLCIAGFWCMMSAVSAIMRKSCRRVQPAYPVSMVSLFYLGTLLLLTVIAWLAKHLMLPPFFIHGNGPTALRQYVLAIAIVQFFIAVFILRILYARSRFVFLQWYSLGLLLLAVGLLGVWLTVPGTPLNWTSRVAQFLAGPYILIAILALRREEGGWGISLERSLRESRERFRIIFDDSPIAGAVQSLEGRNEHVNKSYCELMGYGEEDLRDISALDLTHPDDREETEAAMRRLLSGEIRVFHCEKRYVRKDGSIIWADVHVTAAQDKFRKPLYFILQIQDITGRKLAEQALRDSEEKYRMLAETAHDMIFIIGRDDLVVYVNTFAAQALGLKPSDIIGQPREKFFPSSVEKRQYETIKRVMDTGQSAYAETITQFRDRKLWLGTWLVALRKDDRINAVLGISRDITEQKHAEEILMRSHEELESEVARRMDELVKAKRLSDIGTFAATIAHELRNPLGTINMAASNIRQKAKDASIEKHLHTIEKKVAESDQIINNLLFYSRIGPPHKEKVNVYDIIEECIDITNDRGRKASVTKDYRSLDGVMVDVDPIQMKEVCHNIMNNAYDALPTSGGGIKISGSEEGGLVKISFIDNGMGIKNTDIERIFDPFFTTKTRGTGLGLTVCQQIMKMHDGEIYVKSEPGRGTNVVITIPKGKAG